jgi:hypothetical protein
MTTSFAKHAADLHLLVALVAGLHHRTAHPTSDSEHVEFADRNLVASSSSTPCDLSYVEARDIFSSF